MIQIDQAAQDYFRKLLARQGIAGLAVRMRAVNGGSATGDCKLEFCEPDEIGARDYQVELPGFAVVIDADSAPFLEGAELSFVGGATGGELTVRAPRLKSKQPGPGASLVERVQYVLDAEINPGVAAHGGKVSLVEVSAAGEVVLRFGGGCQGCGSADATLKHGIEKTLRARLPEITAVRDATDHSKGEQPYYPGQAQAGRSALA